jgi:hypothetical protein
MSETTFVFRDSTQGKPEQNYVVLPNEMVEKWRQLITFEFARLPKRDGRIDQFVQSLTNTESATISFADWNASDYIELYELLLEIECNYFWLEFWKHDQPFQLAMRTQQPQLEPLDERGERWLAGWTADLYKQIQSLSIPNSHELTPDEKRSQMVSRWAALHPAATKIIAGLIARCAHFSGKDAWHFRFVELRRRTLIRFEAMSIFDLQWIDEVVQELSANADSRFITMYAIDRYDHVRYGLFYEVVKLRAAAQQDVRLVNLKHSAGIGITAAYLEHQAPLFDLISRDKPAVEE